MSTWKYVFHPHLRQTYVPVTRLPGEHIWREICVPLDLDLADHDLPLHQTLCNALIKPKEALERDNISSSDVWLAQINTRSSTLHLTLDNIVEGSCFQFGRMPLTLSQCFPTEGKNAL